MEITRQQNQRLTPLHGRPPALEAAQALLTKVQLDYPAAKVEEIWMHPETRDQMMRDLRIPDGRIVGVWGVQVCVSEELQLDEVRIYGTTPKGGYGELLSAQLNLIDFA